MKSSINNKIGISQTMYWKDEIAESFAGNKHHLWRYLMRLFKNEVSI